MNMKSWKGFFERYLSDNGYWYIPKGLTVKEENFALIKDRLTILKGYEGSNWSKVQSKFVNDLTKKKLFERRVDHDDLGDNAAIGRMFKVVVSNLGLAWINEDENVFITDVGNKIISSNAKKTHLLINNQINKFQFYNPSFARKEGFTNINLLPIQFLCEVINELDEKYISKEEYILFISKKKFHNDVENTIEEIIRFRNLSDNERNRIIGYYYA